MPKSIINMHGSDQIELDLDTSTLTIVFTNNGEDCTSGVCVPFIPSSVPLKGTFTIYRGPGSYTAESHGSTQRNSILPFGGITFLEAFTGTKIEYSAVFAGLVGMVTVVPPAPPQPTVNASLTVMKGQQVFQTVYPQVP